MRKLIFPIVIAVLSGCDQGAILHGADDIPIDYIEGMSLDPSKIKYVDVFVNKLGKPVVELLYENKYNLIFFSCEASEQTQLLDLLTFENSPHIGISPNITYRGNGGGYVEVRFPIDYSNLLHEPFNLITEVNSQRTVTTLNDSTKFVLLENSKGFKLRHHSKSYDGIVINVLKNQITDFDGHTDLGIFIYRRKNKDYFLVTFANNPNRGLSPIKELFSTLSIQY
ncbi:hypothetical protein [Sphingobacterium haloxyli]|uniref:Uncharacterized protein n=1 Tax=Sphingobacterium haloxyli TaxID=2100533 RepID=A0A2S9IVI6_9SPHI|nr:hypothetical protein [Sphingobacterium haloxyli]PRD44543.1 hypothetical protein C5745_19385 [Sphingobacterium haloxyli]